MNTFAFIRNTIERIGKPIKLNGIYSAKMEDDMCLITELGETVLVIGRYRVEGNTLIDDTLVSLLKSQPQGAQH